MISRFEDGRIIEDWAASDTMELVRQLGLRRTLGLAVKHRKLIFDPEGWRPPGRARCVARSIESPAAFATRPARSLRARPSGSARSSTSRRRSTTRACPASSAALRRQPRVGLRAGRGRGPGARRRHGPQPALLPSRRQGHRHRAQPRDGRARSSARRGARPGDRHASRRRHRPPLPRRSHSTRWSAPMASARSPMTPPPCAKRSACSGPAGASSSLSMSAVRTRSCGRSSGSARALRPSLRRRPSAARAARPPEGRGLRESTRSSARRLAGSNWSRHISHGKDASRRDSFARVPNSQPRREVPARM